MHKPSWYKDGEILIVNSLTCGINKDGREQYIVNPETGIRSTDNINDSLAAACDKIKAGEFNRGDVGYCKEKVAIGKDVFIPKYHDSSFNTELKNTISGNELLVIKSLGELIDLGYIEVTNGHGSPSSDQRLGVIPYIKVSDLRAGSVNINPTNLIPETLAQKFWKDNSSGLQPYDLISPERASKNIGEFCVLMPGQQDIVLTKEVIIIRATKEAPFSQFYLMWALSLSAVRKQWNRIVFMQTNREDVGKRTFEIIVPLAKTKEYAELLAKPFKDYYESLESARNNFIDNIETSNFKHHIYLGSVNKAK